MLVIGREATDADEELALLSALADQASLALQTERLREFETGELVRMDGTEINAAMTSERRLKDILDSGALGTWDWNTETDTLVWSDAHYTLLGLKPGVVKPGYRVWAERIHPDDLPRINAELESAAQSRKPFRGEYRAVWPDGTIRWIQSRGRFSYAPDGRPLRILGVVSDITESKRAEATLAHFHSLVDSAFDAIYSESLDGTLTTWNSGAEKLYGYSAQEVLGRPLSITVPADRREELVRTTERILNGELVEPVETMRLTKTGKRISVSLTLSPVYDMTGAVVGVSTIARDISEHERIREALKKAQEFSERMLESSSDCIQVLNSSGRIIFVSAAWKSLMGVDDASVFQRADWLSFWKGGDKEAARGALLFARAGSIGRFQGSLVTPAGERKWFDVSVSPILGSNGDVESILAISRDTTVQKHAEQAFLEAADNLDFALTSAGMTAFDLDIATGDVRRSGNVEELIGLGPKDNFDVFLKVVHPADLERFQHCYNNALSGSGRYECEYRILRFDGSIRWISDKGRVVFDEHGTPARLTGVATDITDKLQAEPSLRESEEQFRTIVETANEGVWLLDLSGNILFANRRMAEILGYAVAEIIGHSITDFCFLEDITAVNQSLRRNLEGTSEQFELRFRQSDGSEAYTLACTSPMRNGLGVCVGAIGMFTDVTRQRQTTLALKDSEERLRLAVQDAGISIWDWDIATDRLVWSSQLDRLFGFEPGINPRGFRALLDSVHEDDRAIFESALNKAIETGESYDSQFRIVLPEGTIRWISARGSVHFEYGRATRMIGVGQDVTSRKRVEEGLEELLDREQRLATQLRRLVAASFEINSTVSFERLAKTVSEKACEIVGAHQAIVTIDSFKQLTAASISEKYENWNPSTSTPYPKGISSFVCRINDPVRLSHKALLEHPAWRGEAKEEASRPPLRGFLGAPLIDRDGRNIGLIQLSDRYQGEFDQGDENLLVQLALAASAAIENLRLIEETQREVSERKQAEDALRESEERHRALVAALTSVIWFADASGCFTSPQTSWTAYTAQTWEDQAGWGWTDKIHPDDRETFKARWHDALERQSFFRAEGRIWHERTGEFRFCEARAVPLFTQSEELREWVGTFTDIHDRKRAEEERHLLLIREKEAREIAEAGSRIKDDFLATISHELRTPLTAVLGWSKMLADGQLDGKMQAHAIQTIERNALAQSQLIEDLLDVSRIISGKIRFEARLTHLKPVINAAVEVVWPAAEARGTSIDLKFETNVDTILGDATRVQQIVWNLLANAVKFTPPHGTVVLTLSRSEDILEITVKDNGSGISPEFLPYVFERFRQADGATTRNHGGLGLGLAIVRHLAELHGGTVRAHSEGDGKGSEFRVTFPLATQAFVPGESEGPVMQSLHSRNEKLKGLHIHVVDDEPDTVDLIRIMLTEFGASVTVSGSAREAIEALKKLKPDVLISDIGMPEQDGYDLIKTLRAFDGERGRALPAIALTAYAAAEDKQRALLAGFQTHIPKPIEPIVLITAITRLVGRDT
jgi:PAS domain S-box-containing protein